MHSANVGLMLAHRLRHWPNFKSALAQLIVFADQAAFQGYTGGRGVNLPRSAPCPLTHNHPGSALLCRDARGAEQSCFNAGPASATLAQH